MNEQISVANFSLLDLTYDELVSQIIANTAQQKQFIYFALHIGGLRLWRDKSYTALMAEASGVYADGQSVVLLSRFQYPHSRIQRSPTTDIGFSVISEFQEKVSRPARVALVGGPPGLASRALSVLEASTGCEGIFSTHGYHSDWWLTLQKLQRLKPDFIFVGLGVPMEMEWCVNNKAHLPNATLMTCGGWFSFIVGDEQRAPKLIQRIGLEWFWRLMHSPARLWSRYFFGLFVFSELAVYSLLGRRWHRK